MSTKIDEIIERLKNAPDPQEAERRVLREAGRRLHEWHQEQEGQQARRIADAIERLTRPG